MRKPLLALSLCLGTGLGASQVAGALAANPNSPNHPTTNSTSTITTTPPKTPQTSTISTRTHNAVSGSQIVQTALRYLGYPYTMTGNSPQTGFSCIGFVSYVYRTNGIPLPGDLGGAMAYAPAVPFSQLEPGDILFFGNTIWTGLSHTGIYLGGGKFVHAEWYNRGVVVSSFNNDKVDGNYWIGKYLGAVRPWGGVAGSAVVNIPSAGQSTTAPVTTTPSKAIFNGPTATVTVPLLNVRVSPSKSAGVRQIVPQGTSLVVLGKSHGWYKVQLPDGTIGWIVAAGIGTAAPTTTAQAQVGANPTVGQQVTPKSQSVPTQTVHTTASVRVSALNVHTSPSKSAPIITAVGQGQQLQILARGNGWMKVRTPDGSIGWVKTSMTSARHGSVQKAATSTGPAYKSVTPPQSVQHKVVSTSTRGPYLTASVRVHVAPGLRARVIMTAGIGTHVQVLGYNAGWARVRLVTGVVGYVYGSYVHR